MKVVTLILLVMFPLASFAGETAYQALRAIGAQRSPDLLSRVLEVRGRNGIPQPSLWTIVLDDPLARGGVREIEVSNGHIVSERTPIKAYSGSTQGIAMNFQKLNLDSSGAFTLAEAEAKANRVGFDSVDYVLRCEQAGSAPAWEISLQDAEKRNVGSLSIAADGGAIQKKNFVKIEVSYSSHGGYQEFVKKGGVFGAVGRFGDSVGDSMHHAGKAVGRTFRHTGGVLEEFFTGDRTIDQQDRKNEGQ